MLFEWIGYLGLGPTFSGWLSVSLRSVFYFYFYYYKFFGMFAASFPVSSAAVRGPVSGLWVRSSDSCVQMVLYTGLVHHEKVPKGSGVPLMLAMALTRSPVSKSADVGDGCRITVWEVM